MVVVVEVTWLLNEEVGYKKGVPRAKAIFLNGVAHTSCMVKFASSWLNYNSIIAQ